MGNAFVAGLKNEAPRGRDVTNEDRNSEASQRGTQRDAEGSEFSYTIIIYYAKRQKNHYKCSIQSIKPLKREKTSKKSSKTLKQSIQTLQMLHYVTNITINNNDNNNNNKFISYGANSTSKAPRPTYSSSGKSSTVSQKRPQTEHCYGQHRAIC